jgi:hypothetical protein
VPTKSRRRSVGPFVITSLVSVVFATVVLSYRPAYSGQADSERDEDLGLMFVGTARQIGTLKPIPGVQVRAEMGNRRIMVRTNSEGQYKLVPNFGADVNADSITVSCAKDGYETTDVNRRVLSNAANAPVVVECLMAPKP